MSARLNSTIPFGELFLFVVSILFLFAPLNLSALNYFIDVGEVGNELGVFFGLFFLGLIGYFFWSGHFYRSASALYLKLALGASLLFFLVVVIGTFEPLSTAGVIRYLVLIWLVPVMLFIRHTVSGMVFVCLFVGLLCLQAQWGIAQFIVQIDLGLSVAGESVLRSGLPGVATFSLSDEKIIRAYGPYQHPNMFGAAMAAGLVTLIFILLLHSRDRSPVWQSLDARIFFLGVSFFLALALLLSFSRNALAVLGLGLIGCFVWSKLSFVRGRFVWVVLALLLLLVSPLYLYRTTDVNDVALSDRWRGYQWAGQLFSWGGGVGPGNYMDVLQEHLLYLGIAYQTWEVDYVHSAPLLLLIEIGVWPIIVSMIILRVVMFHWISWRGVSWIRLLFWLSFLPVFLFDHFFVTSVAFAAVFVWGIVAIFSHRH